MDQKPLDHLFRIFSSEQNILLRTDQKAYTLLALVGLLMTFFFVHFTKIPSNLFTMILIYIYMMCTVLAISSLLLVIVPRIKKTQQSDREDKANTLNPTFFGGITQFASSSDYAEYLMTRLENENQVYQTFADTVYSVAQINAYKNKYLSWGIVFFSLSMAVEIAIVLATFLVLNA